MRAVWLSAECGVLFETLFDLQLKLFQSQIVNMDGCSSRSTLSSS